MNSHVREPIPFVPDTFTQLGANRLRRIIEAYWLDRGFMVQTRLVPLDIKKSAQFYGERFAVRSDIINGYPGGRHESA